MSLTLCKMDSFVEQFRKNGYVVIEDFVTDDDINLMKKECEDIISTLSADEHKIAFNTKDQEVYLRDDYFINSGDKIKFFFEQQALDDQGEVQVENRLALNKIGHGLHVLSPIFRSITHSDKVKEIMRNLEFVDPVIMQSMYIFKQPRIGGEVTPHQDGTYLFTEPMKTLGFWIALDDSTVDNGCLNFIPGSHQGGLYGNYRLIRKTSMSRIQCIYEGDKPNYDLEKFIHAPVKKGSLVIIDGLVVHWSEKNTSNQARHAYAFHVFDSGVSEWSKQNWLQPTNENTFTHLYDCGSVI